MNTAFINNNKALFHRWLSSHGYESIIAEARLDSALISQPELRELRDPS